MNQGGLQLYAALSVGSYAKTGDPVRGFEYSKYTSIISAPGGFVKGGFVFRMTDDVLCTPHLSLYTLTKRCDLV